MDNQQDADLCLDCNSPVYSLHDDILWRIFTLNADMEDFEGSTHRTEKSQKLLHPLNIARFSSQVCRQWRETIIGCSSIWAGLIDLEQVDRRGNIPWMEEVLRRTGQSLLSVYGSTSSNKLGKYPAWRKFFISILTDHWPRIRKFCVEVDLRHFKSDSTLWDLLYESPSPHLEDFTLPHYFARFDLPFKHRGNHLFSNCAPSLQAFHLPGATSFNYQASWVIQLRKITLSTPLTIQDALGVLSRTTRLEKLVLETVVYENPLPPHSPQINLPRLHHIRGTVDVRTILALFQHVTPSPICALDLDIIENWQTHEDVVSVNVASMRVLFPSISRFIESYFSSGNVSECHIRINHNHFSCAVPSTGNSFSFTVPSTKYLPLSQMMVFPARLLKTVVKLEFTPRRSPIQQLITSDEIQFFLSLTSVQTLRLSYSAVELIDELAPKSSLIFPSLRTIQLQKDRPLWPQLQSHLIAILSRWKNALCPVAVIDLSEWKYGLTNWGCLEVLEGFTVVWNFDGVGSDEEYICGSGQPERLNFRQKSSELTG